MIGPLFSVVIPCCNAEGVIQDTLDSVARQTFSSFEIILVDDASSDATLDMVNAFALRHPAVDLKILAQTSNQGPASCRNAAWDTSRGTYLAFLDADDLWHPRKLEILGRVLSENPMTFLGHASVVSPEGVVPSLKDSWSALLPRRVGFLRLLVQNFAHTPSIVIARNIPERFNEGMRFLEDHELWIRIALTHPVHFLPVPLSILRRPPLSAGGHSASRWEMRKGEMRMFLELARNRKRFVPCLPMLLLLSILKHVKKEMSLCYRQEKGHR